ncbi:MAG TPA: hypothetical protein VKR54_03820 [Candidatus Babeliales bacterium]|jgi:hypothetical protein|nr:hypothetical protein [Candidatus Babeliales bacterium]
MEFIKLVISSSERYSYDSASNIKMNILGDFLVSDVIHPSSFINWALDTESDHACANLTDLDKENDYILMSDLYSEEETPTELKMTQKQFVQILTNWEEKVLKLKPKEVIIKYENDQFIIETKD